MDEKAYRRFLAKSTPLSISLHIVSAKKCIRHPFDNTTVMVLDHVHVNQGALNSPMSHQFTDFKQASTAFREVTGKGMPTLIVTLLIIRRWPSSVTRTILSADKQWRLSAGYGASPRRVSSSSFLMASRSPLPRGCSIPSLVVSSKTHLPPA